ncbi:MAG TPA: ribonuclease D [Alphaproteobacteria bacterium]|nr:ribonuclease D [Alphaproteobacteria bacterium]
MRFGLAPIDDTAELKAVCHRLATERYITIDTEFIRERSFWSRLCLVQLAGRDEAVAIDPLGPNLSLEPLFALLIDERVLKVFHAARQDIEIFVHLMDRVPHPLFDTQIAAMVCGFGDSIAYDNLATKLAKVHLDKDMRFTDWARRPLTEKQIRYALDDVIHLRTIYDKLEARLEKNGRVGWIAEEMAVLTEPATYRLDPQVAWQRLKPRTRNPRTLAVLKAVAAWREREAQRLDVPRRRILKDEGLPEIAASAPRSVPELERVRGAGLGQLAPAQRDGLLAAIADALAIPDSELPVPPAKEKPAHDVGPLVDLLKVLLKANCEAAGVAHRLVAQSEDLEAIAAEEAPRVHALSGWRYELFGKDALALKSGQAALAIERGRVRLIPRPRGEASGAGTA